MGDTYEQEILRLAEQYAAHDVEAAAARKEAARAGEVMLAAEKRLKESAEPLQKSVGRNITERFVVLSDGRVLVVKWIGEQTAPLVTIHETVNRG